MSCDVSQLIGSDSRQVALAYLTGTDYVTFNEVESNILTRHSPLWTSSEIAGRIGPGASCTSLVLVVAIGESIGPTCINS